MPAAPRLFGKQIRRAARAGLTGPNPGADDFSSNRQTHGVLGAEGGPGPRVGAWRVRPRRPGGAPTLHRRPGGAPTLHRRPGGARILHSCPGGARILHSCPGGARILHSRPGGARILHSCPGRAPILHRRPGGVPKHHRCPGGAHPAPREHVEPDRCCRCPEGRAIRSAAASARGRRDRAAPCEACRPAPGAASASWGSKAARPPRPALFEGELAALRGHPPARAGRGRGGGYSDGAGSRWVIPTEAARARSVSSDMVRYSPRCQSSLRLS